MKSVAELEKEITKRLKAKEGQAAEKTLGQIEKEILENREAMEASAAKKAAASADKESEARALIEAKEAETKAAEQRSEVHETKKPKGADYIPCPFCDERKSPQGMSRHIIAIHGISGVSLEDLESVKKGEKTPDDLADEKLEGVKNPVIYGLSSKVENKYFSDWPDVEEEDLEETNLGPEDGLEAEQGPGEKGANGIPRFASIVGIVVVAAIILRRVDPRFKEVIDELINKLVAFGSKKSSSPEKSFAQHAADLYKTRGS